MLNTGLNPNVVKTALDKIWDSPIGFERQPHVALATDSMLYKQDSIDRGALITETIGLPSEYESHTESETIREATVRTGQQQTHTIAKYAESVRIPVEFFDDDQHSVVKRTIENIVRKGRMTQHQKAVNVYADGFTTTQTGDSVSLFNDSHTTIGGGSVDNLFTASFAPDSFESMITALAEQKDQNDELAGHVATWTLVPQALLREATEVLESELVADTMDNNTNAYFSQKYGVTIKMSPQMGANYGGVDGGSDTAFVVGSDDHNVTRVVRKPLETYLRDYKMSDKQEYVYTSSFRELSTVGTYEGLVGNNGTA